MTITNTFDMLKAVYFSSPRSYCVNFVDTFLKKVKLLFKCNII